MRDSEAALGPERDVQGFAKARKACARLILSSTLFQPFLVHPRKLIALPLQKCFCIGQFGVQISGVWPGRVPKVGWNTVRSGRHAVSRVRCRFRTALLRTMLHRQPN